jgi:hypothetical protein
MQIGIKSPKINYSSCIAAITSVNNLMRERVVTNLPFQLTCYRRLDHVVESTRGRNFFSLSAPLVSS